MTKANGGGARGRVGSVAGPAAHDRARARNHPARADRPGRGGRGRRLRVQRRHHRRQRTSSGSPPVPTATSGSPRSPITVIGRITTAGNVTVFSSGSSDGQFHVPDHSQPRREPLVHAIRRQPQLGTSHDLRPDHLLPPRSPRPRRPAGPLQRSYHRRPRRQPLVHGVARAPHRPHHAGGRRHGVLRGPERRLQPRPGSRPVPTATSGSRSRLGSAIGRITPAGPSPSSALPNSGSRYRGTSPPAPTGISGSHGRCHRQPRSVASRPRGPGHRVLERPHRLPTRGDHGRARRQSLVHRVEQRRIGRITPAGVITEFTAGSAPGPPGGIAAGADGNLWFAEVAGDRIGRRSPWIRRPPRSSRCSSGRPGQHPSPPRPSPPAS